MHRTSIRKRYRILMIAAVTMTLILTGLLMGREMVRIVQNVAHDYARLYNNEIAGELEAHLISEVALSNKAANTDVIRAWMKEPDNEELKKRAFSELMHFNSVYSDGNLFIALEKTQQIYFLTSHSQYEDFVPSGTLNPERREDVWYYKTIGYDKPFMLNIDIDRFLNTMRVWVNVKVQDDSSVLGAVGTGLYLQPFNHKIFGGNNGGASETVIMNRFGSIQMDLNLKGISQNSFAPETDLQKTVFRYSDDPTFKNQVNHYLKNSADTTVLALKHDKYQYAALTPIHETEWHAVTFFSTQALYDFRNMIPVAVVMLGTLIAMAALIGSAVQRTFVKPFEQLKESLRLKEGTLDVEIFGLDREDEFGELAKSIQQLTERLVSAVPVGVFRMNSEGDVYYGNPYFLGQFACEDIEEFRKLTIENPSGAFKYKWDRKSFMQSVNMGNESITYEAEFVDARLEVFWAEIRCNKSLHDTGNWEYECILINVQDVKEHEQSLMSMAITDRLTGIFNRYHLERIVAEEVSRSERYGGPLSLVIFDLDHFKNVNDTLGHHVGDDVLVATARQAQMGIRQNDILARWGGEEFAILLPGAILSGAEAVAEHVRKILECYEHPQAGKVTASFGVAERLPGESYESWFKRADEALFEAKNSGRNRVSVNTQGQPGCSCHGTTGMAGCLRIR